MTARPISGVLIAMSVISALWPVFAKWREKKRRGRKAPSVRNTEDSHA